MILIPEGSSIDLEASVKSSENPSNAFNYSSSKSSLSSFSKGFNLPSTIMGVPNLKRVLKYREEAFFGVKVLLNKILYFVKKASSD